MRMKARSITGLAAMLGLTLAAATPALAGQPMARPDSQQTLQAERVVMLCETDRATRQAFTREFGAPPVFVTAREAEAARTAGETWDAPRCMTAREHARLTQAQRTRASLD